ncbi:MAG: DNA-binding protein [Nitrospirales bacterium]|nr:DNA-binding protein [Nitrospirales bacterium]
MKLRVPLSFCLAAALCISLAQPAFSADELSGKVMETMNSGGYTYVRLLKDGENTWVAVPQMDVTIGSEASFAPGNEMTDFESKSLNRKFDRIIFSNGPAGKAAADSGLKPTGSKDKMPVVSEQVKVEKAAGADAYTIAEVYEKSAELSGKPVVIKGKVVKFSSGILQKNWIHIQDGSGDQEKGTNDLVVTIKDELSVSDIVTVAGNLVTNKDFGFGYKYAVIIEDATITK